MFKDMKKVLLEGNQGIQDMCSAKKLALIWPFVGLSAHNLEAIRGMLEIEVVEYDRDIFRQVGAESAAPSARLPNQTDREIKPTVDFTSRAILCELPSRARRW